MSILSSMFCLYVLHALSAFCKLGNTAVLQLHCKVSLMCKWSSYKLPSNTGHGHIEDMINADISVIISLHVWHVCELQGKCSCAGRTHCAPHSWRLPSSWSLDSGSPLVTVSQKVITVLTSTELMPEFINNAMPAFYFIYHLTVLLMKMSPWLIKDHVMRRNRELEL